jgi:hypothetical protein
MELACPLPGQSQPNITSPGFDSWVVGGDGWIDTGAIYGLANSRELVAGLLRELHPADRLIIVPSVALSGISTSGGLKLDSIRHGCEASLRRLRRRTDRTFANFTGWMRVACQWRIPGLRRCKWFRPSLGCSKIQAP